MDRVLLVVANREQFPEPAFPLGALYVAGALEAAGAEVRVFDAGLHRRPLAALRAELATFRPGVVGLSLRNADNASYPCTRSYIAWYERVAETVRASAPAARIVLGGPAFSIFAAEICSSAGGRRRRDRRRRGAGGARTWPTSAGPLGAPAGRSRAAVWSARHLGAVFPGADATARPACRPRAAARTAASTARTRPSRAPACGGARRRRSPTRPSACTGSSASGALRGRLVVQRRRGAPGGGLRSPCAAAGPCR